MKQADSVFSKMELKGEWWLPERPEDRVQGDLVGSDAEGFSLVLRGSPFGPNGVDSHPVIHGYTPAGLITLLGSFCVKKAADETTCYTPLVLKGTLIAAEDELCFARMTSKFSVLDHWIWGPPAQTGCDKDSCTLTFQVTLPDDVMVFEDDRFSVSLSFDASYRETRNHSYEALWGPRFTIIRKTGRMLWRCEDGLDYRTIIDTLNQFLSVVTLEPSYAFDLVGDLAVADTQPVANSARRVELYGEREVQPAQCMLTKFLFHWKSIQKTPQPVFGNWFSKYPAIRGSGLAVCGFPQETRQLLPGAIP